MSSSNNGYTGTARGKGKGKEKRKRRRHHHPEPPRKTETAPHILAALEAQRARSAQQAPPAIPEQAPTSSRISTLTSTAAATTTKPPPLPGYVFDPARNRFFREVKDSLGTPRNVSSNRSLSSSSSSSIRRRRNNTILVNSGRNNSSRPPPPPLPPPPPPPPPPPRTGKNSCGISISAARRCSNNGSRGLAVSSLSGRGLGLHSYARNSRLGPWGLNRGARGAGGGPSFVGDRNRRAGIESIVSSSRFRLRSLSPESGAPPRGGYSAIDWGAAHDLLVIGTNEGELGKKSTAVGGRGDPRHPRRVERQHEDDGVRDDYDVRDAVRWGDAPLNGQVSDIKFSRTNGYEGGCAIASSGSAGGPGGVHARVWGAHGTSFQSPGRVCQKKLRRGSVLCTEWDPLGLSKLAVGPSSYTPVSILDMERQVLAPVVKLSSDVFSMSFLPEAAPGAGHAFICGCRDGSVILVDPRQPPRHNASSTTAALARGVGGGSGGGGHGSGNFGGARRTDQLGGLRRSGGAGLGASARHGGAGGSCGEGTEVLVRLDCSSVDHTHVLQDGTRCLVKDRSGGLQVMDLRVFAGRGRGQQGQGRPRPLKVLVQPRGARFRPPAPRRFALDPTETVVVTPVAAGAAAGAAAAAAAFVGGCSSGSSAGTAGGAWGAFSSSGSGDYPYRGPTSTGDADSVGFIASGDAGPRGDKLRILNVSSGEVLNDIQTPWTGMSLARGGGPGSASDPDFCGIRFWGTAWEPGQGAAVFEARLRPEARGGYGR